MRTSAGLILVLSFLCIAFGLEAQTTPAASGSHPVPPYVEFDFEWTQGHPWTMYTISVEQGGRTYFHGIGSAAEVGDGDPVDQQFQMSPPNLQKIFDLAKGTNYFQGDFEARQKNIAKTGRKTLTYRAEGIDHSTTYNYSPNQDIEQLTKLFQSIANTLDFGRKLEYQYRFDKLGMDARLNELADMQKTGYVQELQSIEPILRKIADDANLMHINRQQARQLLKSISGQGAQPPAAQP